MVLFLHPARMTHLRHGPKRSVRVCLRRGIQVRYGLDRIARHQPFAVDQHQGALAAEIAKINCGNAGSLARLKLALIGGGRWQIVQQNICMRRTG